MSGMIMSADPKASYQAHRKEIDTAIATVLESGWYILGKEVTRFEEEFAAFIGVKQCVSVASGTDAILIALLACGLGPGDGVITVSNTAVATVAAIELCGAVPVLVDVDADTFTIEPRHVEEVMRTNREGFIKAVVPVHLFGHPADMDAIMTIATCYKLCVIEDCAQAHGARFRGKRVGSIGAAGAFSFYPTKNLGAIGDGGGIVTSDPDLAQRVMMLRQYGWKERYISDIPGMNSRLDEIQAAILRVKLKSLEEGNRRRRAIANLYRQGLADTQLVMPVERKDCEHVYHQFVIRCPERDSLKAYLQKRSVGTAVLYPVPIHKQAGYVGRIPVSPMGLHHTETLSREILCLPVYPEISENQVARVIDGIRGWCRVR